MWPGVKQVKAGSNPSSELHEVGHEMHVRVVIHLYRRTMSDPKSAPVDTQPKDAGAPSGSEAKKEGEGKKLPQLGALEDDDEFEDFPGTCISSSILPSFLGLLTVYEKWREARRRRREGGSTEKS